MSNKKTALFIGSGFGALAGAALLAKDGYSVTVLEKNEQLGGRASVLEAEGFRFDMGPSWYLMPDVFDRFFAEFNKKTTDYYKLISLEPQYRNYFADGTVYDVLKDVEKTIEYFESVEKGAGKKLRTYLKDAEKKYQIAMNHYLYRNIDTPLDFFTPELLNVRLSISMAVSMELYCYSQFKDSKLRQLLTYALVFMGCSPQNAPALFSLINHVDFNLNVFYPEGGMSAVVKAFVDIGKEYGVQYHVNAAVTAIEIEKGSVARVRTQTQSFEADIVVSNADYAHTEGLFNDPTARQFKSSYWEKKVYTPSAFLIYLGVKGEIPELLHHSFIFSHEYDEHYSQVFEAPAWPNEPSLYINKPSATDKHVAPKGHENLMVLVPIAAGLDESPSSKQKYARFIYELIKKRTGVDLQPKVVFERLFSVSDFTDRYNAYKGNAFSGLANTFFQSTFFRQGNKHKKLSNLYFVGVNTQPGVGVPPAIISGHLLRSRLESETDNT